MGRLDVIEVARQIEVPIDWWPGQCYGIAGELLRKGVVEGSLRYGHWCGPVSPDCVIESFAKGAVMFCRHGWIEQDDNTIVDPTRYVFEAREPYIYIGENDHYDAGGNLFREATEKPCPNYSATDKRVTLSVWKFCPVAHRFVMAELFGGAPGITFDMAFWLANLALPRLREHARPIYKAFVDAGQGALIPTDNRTLVLGEE